MMSRNRIDRLCRRLGALEQRGESRQRRVFQVLVENHMESDAEIARFCAEHGVTDDDTLIVRTFIPHEARPGETAQEAYQRELTSIGKGGTHKRSMSA